MQISYLDYDKNYFEFTSKHVNDLCDSVFQCRENLEKVMCYVLINNSTNEKLLKCKVAQSIYDILGTSAAVVGLKQNMNFSS